MVVPIRLSALTSRDYPKSKSPNPRRRSEPWFKFVSWFVPLGRISRHETCNDPIPMLISHSDRTVPVTVQARTTAGPTSAFGVVVPIDLSLVFRGWGPFPGVKTVSAQSGAWDHVGVSRQPELTDGSHANETLTEYVQGHSFAYELTGFTNALGRLVTGVRGEWTFSPDGEGTVIRWTYEFKPRRFLWAVLRFAVAPLWRRYMLSALARVTSLLTDS
jgi:hypothetical protein